MRVPHPLPAAQPSRWHGLVTLGRSRVHVTRGGQQEQAAHPTGQSNTNQLIPFLWKTCRHLVFVTVSVLLLSLCPFTHSLSVVFVVCACVHCVELCLCGCAGYKCAKRDVRILM